MAIKIDLEKAYDRLRWQFIQETLLEARLPQLMVDVILNCISLTSFNISCMGKRPRLLHHQEELGKVTRYPLIFLCCVWKD